MNSSMLSSLSSESTQRVKKRPAYRLYTILWFLYCSHTHSVLVDTLIRTHLPQGNWPFCYLFPPRCDGSPLQFSCAHRRCSWHTNDLVVFFPACFAKGWTLSRNREGVSWGHLFLPSSCFCVYWWCVFCCSLRVPAPSHCLLILPRLFLLQANFSFCQS